MILMKDLVHDAKEVPGVWVYSYYCNVPMEQFNGSEFKINSIFNSDDYVPSMGFYVKGNIKGDKYMFHDFSSGNRGDHFNLVMLLKGLSFHQACLKIVHDYNAWRVHGGQISIGEIKEQARYKVTSHEVRKWTKADQEYWTPYNISSKLLERYNVKPLLSYTMSNGSDYFAISRDYLYGYFKQDGTLYKVYQPKVDPKFVKVQDYLQGSEQVQRRPYLIYQSSLKDVMSGESLNINVDWKAPDSENTLIPKVIVERDKTIYKYMLVMFDTDEAGIKAANRYKAEYGIEPVFLNYGCKDLSDHIEMHGAHKVKRWIVPLIDKKLNI